MKVVVSNSKGLVVHNEGDGFEFSDSHVKPAIETVRHATHVLQFTGPDAASAINGQYFDISSTTANYRVYFDVVGDEAVADDIDFEGRTAVQAALNGAGDGTSSAIQRAAAVTTALNALADFAADNSSGAGLCTVFVLTPGALNKSFDAGTTGDGVVDAAFATETDGSGQVALTLDKRVSVLGQTAANTGDAEITGQDQLTLANGAYAGQEKVIFLAGTGTEAQTVTLTGYTSAGDAGLDTLTLTLTHANLTACNAHLLWDGAGWALLASNGTVAIA